MRPELKKLSLMLLAMTTFLLTLVSGSYGQSVNYYYDDLNRLTRIDYGDTVIDYTYDDVGNRLTESILHPPLTTPSPTGGVYGSSQSVTLTCSDPQGPGCGNIYYTTDGSTPTTSSPVYSAPISISATTTLKYFARDVSNPPINESVKSQTYTIDAVPPTGTVTVNAGAESTTSPNVTLTLTCSDANGCSQMQLSNDNITYSTAEKYSGTKSWALFAWDGTKTVYVKFKDTAGNWSPNPYTDTIVLNNNPPNPPVIIGGSNYTALQDAYNSASNGSTIKCQAIRFIESLTVNRNISVTLDGGYDSGYTSNTGGQTSVKGTITTTTGGGTITIKNFVLEQ